MQDSFFAFRTGLFFFRYASLTKLQQIRKSQKSVYKMNIFHSKGVEMSRLPAAKPVKVEMSASTLLVKLTEYKLKCIIYSATSSAGVDMFIINKLNCPFSMNK